MIYSDGYLLLKTENNSGSILLIDLETGIVRDIVTSLNISRNPCYHDDSSDAVINSTVELINNGTVKENLDNVSNMANSWAKGFGDWFNGFAKNLGTDEGFTRFAEDLMGSSLISIAILCLIAATGPIGIGIAVGAIVVGSLMRMHANACFDEGATSKNWAMAGTSIGLGFLGGLTGIGGLSAKGIHLGFKTGLKGITYESTDIILNHVIGDSVSSISTKLGSKYRY